MNLVNCIAYAWLTLSLISFVALFCAIALGAMMTRPSSPSPRSPFSQGEKVSEGRMRASQLWCYLIRRLGKGQCR